MVVIVKAPCYNNVVEGNAGAFYFAIKGPFVCVKHRFLRQDPAKAQANGLSIRGDVNQRNIAYKSLWGKLIEYYGARCFYCRVEMATTIDHVIPYSYDQDNSLENLVPACGLCNALASDKHFETVAEKRQYILAKRKNRNLRRAICINCLLPFCYRTHSPSLFLCAECYDAEYGTQNANTHEWRQWLKELRASGIPAEAHRKVRQYISKGRYIGKGNKLKILIEEYANVLESDPEFAMLIT